MQSNTWDLFKNMADTTPSSAPDALIQGWLSWRYTCSTRGAHENLPSKPWLQGQAEPSRLRWVQPDRPHRYPVKIADPSF